MYTCTSYNSQNHRRKEKEKFGANMGPYKSEKLLAYCYPILIALGFVCSVTTAVAWNHWKYVLDTCVDRENCGCILNGVSTITYFRGGHIAYCHYATFGLILSMAIALIFGSFHVFRVCISTGYKRSSSHSVRQRWEIHIFGSPKWR